MKTTFILIFYLLSSFVFGQEQEWRLGKSYKTTLDLTVNYIDSGTVKQRIALAGLKYRYLETIDNKIYIQFLKIKKDIARTADDAKYINSNNDQIIYFIAKDKLNDLNKQKNSGIVSGTILAPVKIRPETNCIPWELSTDITLGQYIGYRFPLSKTNPYYLTVPTITLGTSLLSINSSNTAPVANTSTTLGLTWSTGIILDLNGFNVGLLLGKDYAPGKAGKDWIYNEKTWFSVGFGISLTSNNKDL